MALAIASFMVLGSAGGTLTLQKGLTAPYRETVSSFDDYTDFGGCAKAGAAMPAWHPVTGLITTIAAASAKTCGRVLGDIGGNDYADAEPSIEVAIPFTVGSGGNHSITTSMTVGVASSWSYVAGTVCSKQINYSPPLYGESYAYCGAGTSVILQVSGDVEDEDNGARFAANDSTGVIYNQTWFRNSTDCYNFGTPTCTNYSSGWSSGSYMSNFAGFGAFAWSGLTPVTLWTNGTHMVRGHHYYLVVSVYVNVSAYAERANLLAPWSGSASARINLGSLGNGLTVDSISIA